MAQVILKGELAEIFGPSHRLTVRSPAEAIRALDANFPTFKGHLVRSAQDGVSYKIIVGEEELSEARQIGYPVGRQTITFVPMISGASGKGFGIGEILVAAALVAVTIAFPETMALTLGAGLPSLGSIAIGMSFALALGGISSLIAGTPKTPSINNSTQPAAAGSYLFNGAVNVTAQGAPVPVGYGRMTVGSVLISGGISSDPIPGSLTPIEGVTGILVPSVDLTVTDPQTGSFGGVVQHTDVTLGYNAVLTPVVKNNKLANAVIANPGQNYHFPTATCVDGAGNHAVITLRVTGGSITGFIIGATTGELDPASATITISDSLTAGAGGGGGGKGGGGVTVGQIATQDPTTLISHAYASFVDLICEGEIGGLANGAQSIFVNGTPLQNADGSFNFAGLAIYFTTGTQSQPVLPEIGQRVENEIIVGAQVFNGVPITRTITDQTITSVRVTVEFPQMTYEDPTNADIHGTSCEIAVDIQTAGGGFSTVVDDVVTGLCTSPYERSYTIALPESGPPWDIRVRRVSPDPPTLSTQNLCYFESYTEIIDTNLRYVNSSVCGVQIDSSQFQAIPTRSYDVYLLKVKVPSNYDPVARTYSGIWDGTFKIAWTDNPAWAFYDLVTTERYGLGQYVTEDMVDKWTLYQIAKYCDVFIPDGFGGQRPRFTCNIYLQQQADAFKVIQDLASIFRGVAFWANGTVTARQDSPSDPIYLFSPSNVTEEGFTYAGASAKAMHTCVYVTWNDPTNQYQQTVEYVEDQDAVKEKGIIPISLTALGCTNRGQAHNIGKWLLYVEQNESETCTFKTGVEGSGVIPGVVVQIADPTRAGVRNGGRINSADTASITIDSDFIPITGSAIAAILPDGTYQEVAIIDQDMTTAPDGRSLSIFSVSPPWRLPPNPQAQWVISQPNLVPQQLRVISISDDLMKDGTCTIVGLAHNPAKYDAIEDDLPLEPLKIIDFTTAPGMVKNQTLIEQLYVQNNQLKSMVIISWTASTNSLNYLVGYTKDNGSKVNLPKQNSPSVTIRGLDPGNYVFSVVAEDLLGHDSQPCIINYQVRGNTLPPADVQGFQITEEVSDLLLTWNPNADVDLGGYEVRQGDSWDSGNVLITNFSGTSFQVRPTVAGFYQYHIRAISTGGTYSENVSTVSTTLTAPQAVSQFNCIQNGSLIQFSWLQNPEPDIASYEIREGDSWAISTLVVQVNATRYSTAVGTSATRTFWIKAIRSPGIYSDIAEFTTTDTAEVPNMNEVVLSDQVALSWPGQMIYCGVTSDELIMDGGVSRSEYIFPVSLGAEYNAINTVALTLGAVLDDTLAWSAADFAWNNSLAGRQWLPTGNSTSVSARVQIARKTGLLSGEVDGWLCDTTNSVSAVAADTAVGVTYDVGRYNNGIVVGDFTSVAWPVSIPSTFSFVFWFQPAQIVDAVIWSVSASGRSLTLGFSVSRNLFYLRDSNGVEITVAFAFAANDYLIFGMSQDGTNRALYVGNLNEVTASVSAAVAPLGTFDHVNLYG